MATANYDPHLGAGPSEDSEILLDDSDSGSVLSDDSVLPDYDLDDEPTEPAKTLYEACAKNDPKSLRRILERGVTKDEAMELDINGRVRWILRCLLIKPQKTIWTTVRQNVRGDSEKVRFSFPSERADGSCRQGLHRHCHDAARVSINRHQPPGQ